VVDILAGIQKRPENERADAEILNDLSSLVGRDGRLLRLEASERSASSNELRPSPSDDLRRRKIPFRRRVRLPRPKIRGMVVNLTSGAEKIQKHIVATASPR